MYKVYGWRQTGSVAVEAALAEVGAPYELILINRQENQQLSESYKLINPRQQLPALALPDGSIMTEGAAMLLHIADAFPQAGLAPRPVAAVVRGQCL
jgi:glutathione S-transferase